MKRLYADMQSGVFEVDGDFDKKAEYSETRYFYESLGALEIEIFGIVDDKTYAKIQEEYGIHKI